MKIDINICTRDRATELFGLLVSLHRQDFQDFDIYILDDASGTPMQNYHFIGCIIQRLRFEGHRVNVIRNEQSDGICKARQKIADFCIKNGRGDFIARLDDDTVLEPTYLNKLKDVIDAGFDLASGVTPHIANPLLSREVRFVSPVINRVVLEDGKFIINGDDCGHTYIEHVILPADHFRSNALYRKQISVDVKYDDIIAKPGFREEEFFSFRAILKGYKLGVHTGAIAWHLQTPSGGERREEFGNAALMNQKLLNRRTAQWTAEHGDFIKAYHERLGIVDSLADERRSLNKPTNLIFSRDD